MSAGQRIRGKAGRGWFALTLNESRRFEHRIDLRTSEPCGMEVVAGSPKLARFFDLDALLRRHREVLRRIYVI